MAPLALILLGLLTPCVAGFAMIQGIASRLEADDPIDDRRPARLRVAGRAAESEIDVQRAHPKTANALS